MTIVQTEDTRNQEWRESNIGSKLLAKMGWKEGSGIGKRNVNTTALRAVKRQEGLGIGAKRQTEGGPSESTGTFAAVLKNLQAHHAPSDNNNNNKKKTKKLSKKEAKKAAKKAAKRKLSLPQNKVLAGHARKMRAAKFGAKSAEDLACIFGNTEVVDTALGGAFGSVEAIGATGTGTTNKKRERDQESSSSSSSSSEEDASVEKKRKSKKEAGDDEKKAKKAKKEKKSKKKDKKKKKSKSD